jgi:hypothetical protein
MNKRYGYFGFLTGLLCVLVFMLLIYLGLQAEKMKEEARQTGAPGKGAVAEIDGAVLHAIDGPPTQEKIDALLRGDEVPPKAVPPTKKAPNIKNALSVRRSAPTQRFKLGEALDLYLHISKQSNKTPELLVVRDLLPEGWALKEVAASTTPMTVAPEPGSKAVLEFRWERPEKFPITVKYSLEASAEAGGFSHLEGNATWMIADEQNTSALASLELYAAPR